MGIKKKLLSEAIKSAYTSIPKATIRNPGLASTLMVTKAGVRINAEPRRYIRITQLKTGWLRTYCIVTYIHGPSWENSAPIRILIGLSGDNTVQGVKPVLLCGKKDTLKVYKGEDGYVYVQSLYTYNGELYASLSDTSNMPELKAFDSAPTVLSEVPYITV